MYQLDGGAVIKALLAHSTYLKELGVVDKQGQLGGKVDLVVVAALDGALLTATQVRVSAMSCSMAVINSAFSYARSCFYG